MNMMLFDSYKIDDFFDEMFESNGSPRPHYAALYRTLSEMTANEFKARCELADVTLITQGITFTVYGDEQGVDKPFPVDLVPRIVPAHEWERLEKGLRQRILALNHFLHDVYHDQKILSDGVIPRELVMNASHFRRELLGAALPDDPAVQICGTDLIRDADGTYRVLEDNCRTPSGVSYLLENRLSQIPGFPRLCREN